MQDNQSVLDEYASIFDERTQERLQNIYDVVSAKYTNVKLKKSYGMLGFYDDKVFLHVGVSTHHIGLYPGPQIIHMLKDDITMYKTSKGTIQIQNSQEVPLQLIERIIEIHQNFNVK